MTNVLNDILKLPVDNFTVPSGMVHEEICTVSGMKATPYCPTVANEVFISGTQPSKADDWFQPYYIDKTTGQQATSSTPPGNVEVKVFEVVPPNTRSGPPSNICPRHQAHQAVARQRAQPASPRP